MSSASVVFEQIVCLDKTGLTPEGVQALQSFSKAQVRQHSTPPATDIEIIKRIDDADCVLVSWDTEVSEQVLRASRRLVYVGMCCSLYDEHSANVDIFAASELGITVRGIRDYGDEGLVEFIVAQLIFLFKGLGQHQWGPEPEELAGKKLGIIGLGKTGQMLAGTAAHFGMQVRYYSRTRKIELESNTLGYSELPDLLPWADVISIHVPKNTLVLAPENFSMMRPGTVLVNTSLGPTFRVDSFLDWVGKGKNYAILDADGVGRYREQFLQHDRIIFSDKAVGWTAQARERLTRKVLSNIRDYLMEHEPTSRYRR
jgi:phosphoglycerate dehydrogenase-like enzyme